MSHVVGIAVREGRLDVVALRRILGRHRLVAAFSVAADDDAPAGLRQRLQEAGIRARRAYVGLPRRVVVAKAVELPPVPGADVRRMLGFEVERHVPFPPADIVFDFELLPPPRPGQPTRVLLVAIEKRLEERVRTLVKNAGLVPRRVGVAIHSLARMVASTSPSGSIVVWVTEGEAELAVVVGGRIVASRAFALPNDEAERGAALATELDRTLAGLTAPDRAALGGVRIVGKPPAGLAWSDLPIREVAYPASGPPGSPHGSPLALAVALERPTRARPGINLLPEPLRPRPFPWPLAATAALALVTLLIGAAIPVVTLWRESRTLRSLDRRIAQLAPEVQRAERLAADAERARRELSLLRDFESRGLQALPLLRELAETLPADVWLTSFSADRNGVELAGFANAASQLIPLLEASPRLGRVEFTSPVTKGRDREQFRLKASWERDGAAR